MGLLQPPERLSDLAEHLVARTALLAEPPGQLCRQPQVLDRLVGERPRPGLAPVGRRPITKRPGLGPVALEPAPEALPGADPDPPTVLMGRRPIPELARPQPSPERQHRRVDVMTLRRDPGRRLEGGNGGLLLDDQRLVEIKEESVSQGATLSDLGAAE
jgi:hypothetical protein